MSNRKNIKTKKKKKKKKNSNIKKRKLTSAAAILSAAVVVIIILFILIFKTSIFEIKKIYVKGNVKYNNNYIIEKSGVKIGEKIYDVRKKNIIQNITDDPYVKSVLVSYSLPDKLNIAIIERTEQIIIVNNGKYIISDIDGYALREETYLDSNLITIESFINVIYNIGKSIKFEDADYSNKVFNLINYVIENYGSDTIKNIIIYDLQTVKLETKYGTAIKFDINEDFNYQLEFSLQIINSRMENGKTIQGEIDFKKGENPIYTDNNNLGVDSNE